MLEYSEENAAGIPQVFSNISSQLPESCSPATGNPCQFQQLPTTSSSSQPSHLSTPLYSPAPCKWPIRECKASRMGWAQLGSVDESAPSNSGGGSGSPGLALGSAVGDVPWEWVRKSWPPRVWVLASCLPAESGQETPAGAGGRKLNYPRKEQVDRQLRDRTKLCAGRLEVGPGRRRCPRGHGAGGALGDTQVRAAAPPGDSTAEELGRCGAGKKGCCPHCSLLTPWAAAVAVAAAESTARAEEAARAAGRVPQQLFSVVCELTRQPKNRAPRYNLLRALFPCYLELIYAETCLALVPGGIGDSGFDL